MRAGSPSRMASSLSRQHHINMPIFADLGFGLGLRPKHYPYIFEHWPDVGWFEIISENFMDTQGKARRNLDRIRARYPIVMHGVSLSIGTVDPLNSEYLAKLKRLIDEIEPAWVSDHVCWTGVAHRNTHDLLPVPYTQEALAHLVSRIIQVQDYLKRPIALENPSTYLEFKSSDIPEAEFIAQMARQSGCQLLLDVNNVYVSCYNHRLDAQTYLDTLPMDRVIQIHLSGHTNKGSHIIDTHDDHVVDEVWALYRYVVRKAGRTPNTMIEWDDHIPKFDVLYAELDKAKAAAHSAASQHDDALPQLAQPRTPYLTNTAAPLAGEQALLQDAIMLGSAIDSKPDQWIVSKDTFPPQSQLGVYIDSYRARLQDVVAEDYPVLKHAMGEEAFESLIDNFVEQARPTHFNIGRFALKLGEFLAAQPIATTLLHELCRLETALSQLADAEETITLSPADMQHLTPEMFMRQRLYLRRAAELHAFDYPINDYFQQVMDETSPALPAAQPSYLAVFRHDDVVWRMALEEWEYALLQLLAAGQTIGNALEQLRVRSGMNEDTLAEHLTEWFGKWMRNGLLAAPPAPKKSAPRKRSAA